MPDVLARPSTCGKCRRFCPLLGGFCSLHDVPVGWFSKACGDGETVEAYEQGRLWDE